MRARWTTALALLTTVLASAGDAAGQSSHAGRSAAAERQLDFLRAGAPGIFAASRPQRLTVPRRSGVGAGALANAIVNDPSTDPEESSTQNEVTMAVSDDTICVAYNDTGGPGTTGFSRSGDRGRTWEDRGSLTEGVHFGDPVLAVHRASGTWYLADLGLRFDERAGFMSIISVSRSHDGCHTFFDPANASPDASPPRVCAAPAEASCANRGCRRNSDCDSFRNAGDGVCAGPDQEDKPWIAVDNSGGSFDGTVYACWTRFASNGGVELRVSRSVDGGQTFEDEQRVSSGDQSPLGCFVTVGPEGHVYVGWADNEDETPIRVRRSRNGGLDWDGIVRVNHGTTRFPGLDRVITCSTGFVCGEPVQNVRATLTADIRQAAQVWLATDTSGGPHRGNVYAVWVHDPLGMPDNSDVHFSRSTDGGRTWAPEVQLGGGSPTDQFEPFVAVAADGTVSVSWYDRRNDPVNNFMIDVYAALSCDGGMTFEPITRITDASFPVPQLTGQPTQTGNFDPRTSACYMGEYNAAAADNASFYYAWGDNRNRRTTPLYPAGRPDPDVFFASRPIVLTPACIGDCDGDGNVTVDEVTTMVSVALGSANIAGCAAGDADGDGRITVDEILTATGNALDGCAGENP
jgi:hypothetical protein